MKEIESLVRLIDLFLPRLVCTYWRRSATRQSSYAAIHIRRRRRPRWRMGYKWFLIPNMRRGLVHRGWRPTRAKFTGGSLVCVSHVRAHRRVRPPVGLSVVICVASVRAYARVSSRRGRTRCVSRPWPCASIVRVGLLITNNGHRERVRVGRVVSRHRHGCHCSTTHIVLLKFGKTRVVRCIHARARACPRTGPSQVGATSWLGLAVEVGHPGVLVLSHWGEERIGAARNRRNRTRVVLIGIVLIGVVLIGVVLTRVVLV
jgi:hypothetical protein